MRVLVIGSGGREHALVWKLRRSPQCQQIFVWPGNTASLQLASKLDIPHDSSFDALADAALMAKIDLVVVGPEGPLSNGLADILEARGEIFLESKIVTKNIYGLTDN